MNERETAATDMTPKYGGTGSGPAPGTLGRTALGSCMASAYVMWASRMGVPIHGLTVEIEADCDVRGELGLDSVSPTYSEVRCVVTVETDAPEREVCEVLRVADEHCAHLQIFSQPVRVVRETWFALPQMSQIEAAAPRLATRRSSASYASRMSRGRTCTGGGVRNKRLR